MRSAGLRGLRPCPAIAMLRRGAAVALRAVAGSAALRTSARIADASVDRRPGPGAIARLSGARSGAALERRAGGRSRHRLGGRRSRRTSWSCGGGAGGLVLATRLGDRLGRRRRARVTLVDCALTHIWKPLLHEVAAGTLSRRDRRPRLLRARAEPSLQLRARPDVRPRSRRGARSCSTRCSDASGAEMVPGAAARLRHSGDRGRQRAQRLRRARRRRALPVPRQPGPGRAHPSAGARPLPARPCRGRGASAAGACASRSSARGATGVELAAELRHAARQLIGYGLRGFDPDHDVEIRLIEAAPRVLPALPERLQAATEAQLQALGDRGAHRRAGRAGHAPRACTRGAAS